MMKRILSFFLGAALIVTLAVPVSAANDSGWIELLEFSSVQPNGENTFTIAGTSGSVSIPVQGEKRLRKLDMLLWNPSGQRPSSASVTMNGSTTNLEVFAIGSNMCRIVGYVPNDWYEVVKVNFKKSTSTTQTYEVLSCKVTPVGVQEFVCDASVDIANTGTFGINEYINVGSNGLTEAAYTQIRIDVRDWYKYDTLTIWGSCQTLGITAIRASLDTLGLPFTVSYFQALPTGETSEYNYDYRYNENYSGGGGYGNGYGDVSTAIEYGAKTLFCITIDLNGVDRSLTTSLLLVYITGTYYGLYGYSFNCQYVNGSVTTADTSSLSWWNRFTVFMEDLFGSDSSSDALDELGGTSDSISQSASDIHNFEQSQQAVLDDNFAAIQNTITFTNFAAALVFVQKYANLTVSGISKYMVVFTLPLFLGLFFFLCSRVPGITRWKPRPPQKKGGNSP